MIGLKTAQPKLYFSFPLDATVLDDPSFPQGADLPPDLIRPLKAARLLNRHDAVNDRHRSRITCNAFSAPARRGAQPSHPESPEVPHDHFARIIWSLSPSKEQI